MNTIYKEDIWADIESNVYKKKIINDAQVKAKKITSMEMRLNKLERTVLELHRQIGSMNNK